jgi:hypothetical protein
LGQRQRQREGIHPAFPIAAALATVVGTVIALLTFVFGDDNGSPSPEPAPVSAPKIESVRHIPPSSIDASGVSGPIAEGNAIYLVARRPTSGEVVASVGAKTTPPKDAEAELRWRALLDLSTARLVERLRESAVEHGRQAIPRVEDLPGSYEVVAAVLPKVSAPAPESFVEALARFSGSAAALAEGDPVTLRHINTLAEGGLAAAEAVSPPRLVIVP